MDEDSEADHFRMTFVMDGITGRTVRSIETHPDGTEIVTEYEDAPDAHDPYVRSRQHTVSDGPPQEILTEFLPSPIRPATYPAGFPFLAGRESNTTESPAGTVSPGASWRCDDPEAVLAALVEICLADGWTTVPPAKVKAIMRQHLNAAFRRGDALRLFYRLDHAGGSVIQMKDLGSEFDWLVD